ncbi:MAG: HlyD family secretion protein [bacterium]
MRSKRLRKRENTFIKAKNAEKKRFPWGKYLYLAILAIVAFNAVQWAYEYIFYMKAMGFLQAETTFVASQMTSRIGDLKCAIDDRVTEGQPLVLLGNSILASQFQIESGLIDYPTQRKIIDLEGRLALLTQKIFYRKADVRQLQEELNRANELLSIQAVTRSQYLALQDKLKTAEYTLDALEIEFAAATKKLASYNNQIHSFTGANVNHPTDRILYAPTSGIVTNILKQKGEVVKTGEVIVEIINNKHSYVKAYFSGAYEKSIHTGDRALIYFENGEKSQGIVRKIYPSAHAMPTEKISKFGIEKRSLIAEIVPADSAGWNRILETEVKVLVKKKWVKKLGF